MFCIMLSVCIPNFCKVAHTTWKVMQACFRLLFPWLFCQGIFPSLLKFYSMHVLWNCDTQYICLLTYSLTYPMVQSPSWAANWFAASQEIPCISQNPKVHYRTHKRPPPVSILGQPNPVHIPKSHLLEIHPNIIHPSTPRSPQWPSTYTMGYNVLWNCTKLCVEWLLQVKGKGNELVRQVAGNGAYILQTVNIIIHC